jgi:molybdopterin-containing oxidoreductase family iron-sulfur binding subunit
MKRREFIKGTVAAIGATTSGIIAKKVDSYEASGQNASAPASIAAAPTSQSSVERMQNELKRALAKPVEERRWVMVIDLRKCIGCHACTIGCVVENKLPPGVVYRPVMEEEIGKYPNVTRRFIPRPCMQCDNPPCVPVCPVKATWKGKDGIVHINYDQCIGCRYCITACPYGARTSDFGEFYIDNTPQEGMAYEKAAAFEYGKKRTRKRNKSPVGNARKCHFCLHRLNEGMLPMCVTTCIGHATYFGDANDPNSLVAELIAKPNVMRLKEEMGTEPRVYYLI